jgi:hypothetical protein
MNDLDVLTEQELTGVSGGDKFTVVVTKVQEVRIGAESPMQAALESAANAIGTGTHL